MRPALLGLVRGICSGFVVGVSALWLLFRDGRWDRVLAFTFLGGLIWTVSEIRQELKRKAVGKEPAGR
jgi:hypothetical protein